MDEVPPLRLHLHVWWLTVPLCLVFLAVPAWYVIASVTGPSPRLAQVEKEALLVAPIPAVELGRSTRQSQYGVGLPDVSAYVVVAYQVQATPEAALAAWAAAYGQRYNLHDAHNTPTTTMLTGSANGTNVSVSALDYVDDRGVGGSYRAPAPGTTVVTVDVSGG